MSTAGLVISSGISGSPTGTGPAQSQYGIRRVFAVASHSGPSTVYRPAISKATSLMACCGVTAGVSVGARVVPSVLRPYLEQRDVRSVPSWEQDRAVSTIAAERSIGRWAPPARVTPLYEGCPVDAAQSRPRKVVFEGPLIENICSASTCLASPEY